MHPNFLQISAIDCEIGERDRILVSDFDRALVNRSHRLLVGRRLAGLPSGPPKCVGKAKERGKTRAPGARRPRSENRVGDALKVGAANLSRK